MGPQRVTTAADQSKLVWYKTNIQETSDRKLYNFHGTQICIHSAFRKMHQDNLGISTLQMFLNISYQMASKRQTL